MNKATISEIAENDAQKEFKVFFDHYYSRLLYFALRYLNSKMLAEEAVSDVFVKIWKNRKRLLEIENLDAYMFTSVRNQSLAYLKNRNPGIVSNDEFPDFAFINISNPERELLDKELISRVDYLIQQLPPKCQMIFRLSRDEGFKYDEVAQILNISKSTVKNQMTIALGKIKKGLSSYFGGSLDK